MVEKKEDEKGNNSPPGKISGFFSRIFKKSSTGSGESVPVAWQDIKLDISPRIKKYLEMRHVSEDEVKQVIAHAETTKEKIFQPTSERFLAKLRIGKATFYVEYHEGSAGFVIDSAYAHKSEIIG
jgi:hypothetical protein